jgi:hypothetical protein
VVNAKNASMRNFGIQSSYGTPGTETELKDRIAGRDFQGIDCNPVRFAISEGHQARNQPATDARRISQLPANRRPNW